MKSALILLFLASSIALSHAEVVKFTLGPNGLNSANEIPTVANSTGTGDIISGGINLDTTSGALSLAVGYGSSAGFADLTGPATSLHIHSPASTSETAPVLIDLAPFHFPFVDPAKGGVVIGTTTLTSEQSSNLLAGLDYINIHTASNPSGEIRGQLLPVSNSPPVIVCLPDSVVECTGSNINLSIHVSDAEGDALEIVWSVNGVIAQTNTIPANSSASGVDVTLPADLDLGTNIIGVVATDASGNSTSCSSTIVVQDTTPPTISGCTVTPKVLWPPNHKLVPIAIKVRATDTCGTATWKIISVTSNEPIGSGKDDKDKGKNNGTDKDKGKGDDKDKNKGGNGSGNTEPDWVITNDHCVQLRAERSGKGKGRIYTITIQAQDAAGNLSAPKALTVCVPHDQGKK